MNPKQQALVRTIKDLTGLLPAAGQREVLAHLAATLAVNLKKTSPEAQAALAQVLPTPPLSSTLEVTPNPSLAHHRAVDFKLSLLSTQTTAKALLTDLLGAKDTKILISDWGKRVHFYHWDHAPRLTFFPDSNKKTPATQRQDFKAAGLDFVDDLHATIICAALVKKARDAGLNLARNASSWRVEQSAACAKLSEAEIDLLTKLRTGIVETRCGGLFVSVVGRLRSNFTPTYRAAHRWAAGGVVSAESKT